MKQIYGEKITIKADSIQSPTFITVIIIIMFGKKSGMIACVIMARVSCVSDWNTKNNKP